MPGPFQLLDTQLDGLGLDLDRSFELGPDAVLRFFQEDATGLVPGGLVELEPPLTTGFNRVAYAEGETARSQDVVYHVVDTDGTMAQRINDADMIRLDVDGIEGQHLFINDTPRPAPGQSQLYEIKCSTRKMKRTYL
jgi:hypothetical protein